MGLNTLEDVQNAFPDEESARKYLCELRWGKFAECPYCGNKKAYYIENGKRFKCADKNCHKKFSFTVKTVFEASNIPLHKLIEIFFLYSKSRGRIGSFELIEIVGIALRHEFAIRDKLDFVWQYVERDGKTNLEIFVLLIMGTVSCYELFQQFKSAPYYKNPYHISEINNIGDYKQYNLLLRYTKYYINVYCHWIFMDFGSAQDVLSETFLYMADNGIKEYNAEIVIKLIQKTVNKMWFSFLKNHPIHNEWSKNFQKRQKEEQVRNLKKGYLVDVAYRTKGASGMSRTDVKNNLALLEKVKERIKSKRLKSTNVDNTDFQSHFS